jgi:iron complex outermembrane receptor protein
VNNKTLNVTRPYNANGADISGMEFQWQQDFSNGIGWLSNYTFTHATVPSPDEQRILKLPGNSRDQFNASLYYEKAACNVRLSYNYRSKSYGELISGSQDETNAYHQWDLSASWKPKENVTLYLEGINLTDEVIYYRTANNIPQGLYEHGRRFAVGTRLNF